MYNSTMCKASKHFLNSCGEWVARRVPGATPQLIRHCWGDAPGTRIGRRGAKTALVVVGLLLLLMSPCLAAKEGDADDDIYVFTSFRGNGEDGLRYLLSEDGYHWSEVPGTFLKPSVGSQKLMRDPSIALDEDGAFHLVWTTGWQKDQGFGYASSKDMVNWSEQRFIPAMEHEPTTVNVWAPELYFDGPNKRFIIIWASTIPGRFPDHLEPHDNNQRMYYTTTRDFKRFTPTKLYYDPGFSVIDCVIVKDDKRYVLVLKDNTRPQRNLRVAFGDGPLGPWRDVSKPFTHNFTEGPSVLRIGEDWVIYFDAYGDERYGAVKTRDFKTFTDISDDVSFPKGHKHGTAIRVPRKLVSPKIGGIPYFETSIP